MRDWSIRKGDFAFRRPPPLAFPSSLARALVFYPIFCTSLYLAEIREFSETEVVVLCNSTFASNYET